MRHNDIPEFLIMLIAAVILVPLGIWLTKVIGKWILRKMGG